MPAKTIHKKTLPKTLDTNISKPENSFVTNFQKPKFALAIALIGIAILAYFFKGFFIAAIVNGQPIFRFSLIQELENQGGKRTLENSIVKTLILQEAKKQGVVVDKKEVDAEIAKAESNLAKQGQTLDSVLAMQGMTKEALFEQLQFEKLIEKLVEKDIQVTDKEVDEYIEKNKEALPESSDSAQLKELAKEQLRRQKIGEKFQAWLAELRKQAKINYFVQFP